MTFVATEGSTQPIVLGKEPVPRPEITRGPYWFRPDIIPHVIHDDGARATFQYELDGFRVTVHRAEIVRMAEDVVNTEIHADTVVTWELAGS